MKKVLMILTVLLLTGAAEQAWSLPNGLAAQAPRWYETEFHVAWNLARGVPMVGWRFAFALDSPIGLSVSVFLSDAGGLATFDGTLFWDPTALPADVALPLTIGVGFGRNADKIGLALDVSGGVSWYPFTLRHPTVDTWLLGIGGGVNASFYLLPWGIEPLFVTGVMIPVNLSVLETQS